MNVTPKFLEGQHSKLNEHLMLQDEKLDMLTQKMEETSDLTTGFSSAQRQQLAVLMDAGAEKPLAITSGAPQAAEGGPDGEEAAAGREAKEEGEKEERKQSMRAKLQRSMARLQGAGKAVGVFQKVKKEAGEINMFMEHVTPEVTPPISKIPTKEQMDTSQLPAGRFGDALAVNCGAPILLQKPHFLLPLFRNRKMAVDFGR